MQSSGQGYRWKSLRHVCKYWKYVNQAYKLSNKMCSYFLTLTDIPFITKPARLGQTLRDLSWKPGSREEPVLTHSLPIFFPPPALSCTARGLTHICRQSSPHIQALSPHPQTATLGHLSGIKVHILVGSLPLGGLIQRRGLCRLWNNLRAM